MNPPFDNQENRKDELFRPIRDMRSPLSMNAVKNYILDHIGELTIWQKIQRLVFQTGVFTVIIGTICCLNSPAGETKGGMAVSAVNILPASVSQDNADGQVAALSIKPAEPRKINPGIISKDAAIESDPIENTSSESTSTIAPDIASIPAAKVESAIIPADSKSPELFDLPVTAQNQTAPVRAFAEVQGIAYSGRIRMFGEGFGLGVMHDWQVLTLHMMNTNGIHDDRKDAPSLTAIGVKKETGQQMALLFGGMVESDRLYGNLQIGPSYNMSQITSGIREVPASNVAVSQRFFGLSSQVSVGYRISDLLSANIEGLLNYHSAFSGGLMISVMIQH